MTPGLVAILTCPVAVVDRVEDDVAVLDWCGLVRTDVAVALLPIPATEGALVARHELALSRRGRLRGHVASVAPRPATSEGGAPSVSGAAP